MENCINYQERISAFIDGLLTEEERLELMAHMASCPACQQYFDDQIAIHDALTGLEADAPAGFTAAVMARVRETKQDAPEKKVIPSSHWRRWAAAAACCAIAVLGVIGLGDRSELGPAVSQNIASYDLARTQEESTASDDAAAADDKPVMYTIQTNEPAIQTDSAPAEGVAACSVESSADTSLQTASSPPVDLARKERDDSAVSCTLTTASPVAAEWVQEHLGQEWQSGRGYELTAEQFQEVLDLLDIAGEVYTTKPAEEDAIRYLLLAE